MSANETVMELATWAGYVCDVWDWACVVGECELVECRRWVGCRLRGRAR